MSTRELDDSQTLIVCRCERSGGVCARIGSLIETKKFCKWTHTFVSTKTHGALIHCRDYQWSMTGLTLGCTGVPLSQSFILLGRRFVCTQCARLSSRDCVRARFRLRGRFEGRQKWEKTGEEESKQSGGKGKKGMTQTRKCVISRYLCLHPCLTRPHAVVSTMITERWSQSLACSQKTVSWQREATRKKKQPCGGHVNDMNNIWNF